MAQRKPIIISANRQGLNKALMGFIAVLCLVLSSCVIKSQLKSLLGEAPAATLTTKASKDARKTGTAAVGISLAAGACEIHTPNNFWSADAHFNQGAVNSLFGGYTLFLCSAFFLLLTGYSLLSERTKLRFFAKNDHGLRLTALPLFLSHRRLLI